MSRRGHRSCRRAHCKLRPSRRRAPGWFVVASERHTVGDRASGDDSPILTISGIIAPYQNVTLSNNLSEPAAAVYVNEGDHVRRGDVLAILDTSDLQAQYEAAVHTAGSDDSKAQQSVYSAQQTIEQAPQNVATAREAYNQSQANLTQAKADLARDQALESQGYVSAQALQTQQTLANVYAANTRSNRAALNEAIIAEKPTARWPRACRRRRLRPLAKTPPRRARRRSKSRPRFRARRFALRSTASSSIATSIRVSIPARERSSCCSKSIRSMQS